MNMYKITYLDEAKIRDFSWKYINPIGIDCFPWDNGGYKPKTEVRLCYTECGLKVHFTAYETEIRAVYTQVNDMVCRDSCVEMFFIPLPEKDRRYLNIEINAIGTIHTKVGESRHDRVAIPDENWPSLLMIESSVKKGDEGNYNSDRWTIEYTITSEFIKLVNPDFEGFKSGMLMEANFYKCGDDTKEEHYGCWNPIINEVPDFHRPEFFGQIIFE